ncbi:uncharacterized protein PFL1_01101 [Pseudozyma flocculosa PF-1]|uniref:uncharacterized protein n=1 Tax=Pseudozyma flocculosa PF-1 TaxID=1277687 RepID=UPI0004560B7E|nr:uncharacterized protein PFL1_01101 [Pseudozyma flocculosa PF-1]EPQ31769.1 hypothetical protein PFL1_01101 [Pseudozyma flocculosa PF-1]
MIQLPPELLLNIFGSPAALSLLDLARLCLVHPCLAPIARAVAKRHRLRRILLASLGFVPQDVLSLTQWTDARGVDRIERIWDCFVDGFAFGVVNADIIEIADLFSRFSKWIYRSHGGFPALRSGSLPSIPKAVVEPASSSSCNASPSPVQAAKTHRFFLFSNAVVYAAIRGLSRRARVKPAAGLQRIVEDYEDLDSNQREARLRQEFESLRATLLRCDPFGTHVERFRVGRPLDSAVEGDKPALSALNPHDRDCACFDRSWATWYLAAYHHLVTRYRRFTSPADVHHMAYRTILAAVPAFPTSSGLLRSTSSSTGQGAAASQERRDPLLLSTHLNPDSMLFSLQESQTFSQTKTLFNLTEHALAPGMARLWAGNVGYAWGEGGSLWQEESRRSAERRLTEGMRGIARSTQESSVVDDGGKCDKTDDDVRLKERQPIHAVLLAHARWRARLFLRWLHVEDDDTAASDDERRTMLEKARSFDIHFVRRALQIQQWAGLDSFSAVVAAQRSQAQAADHHPRIPAVQVHPSSPFLAFERTRRGATSGKRLGLVALLDGKGKPALASARTAEERARIEEAGWKAILAPLLSLSPSGEAARVTPSEPLRTQALRLLGNLHEGLVHPCLSSGPTNDSAATIEPLCIETHSQPPRCAGSSPDDGRSNSAARQTTVFFSDPSPPGAPDAHPFLVKGLLCQEAWCDDLTSLWPQNDPRWSAQAGSRGSIDRLRHHLARLFWELELNIVLVLVGAVICLGAVAISIWSIRREAAV